MMNTIKIGFLSPYSSIYPELNNEIIEGFVSAFDESFKNKKVFEFVPEYIHQGSQKAVSDAVRKLLHFHNVDIISGLISYKTIPEIIPMLENRNKLGFFFDLGEYIPFQDIISDNVFINSFQLWQSEFALGFWAQKEFGDKGSVIMPMYEAGYHLHSSFRQGTVMAGSSEIDYHILPYVPEKSFIAESTRQLFEKFKAQPPSFIHALFSGTEATEFLTEFYRSGLKEEIPLIISTHMASDEILEKTKHFDWNIYSASIWNNENTFATNQQFVKTYNSWTGKKANVFSLLGYETGLVFKELLPILQKKDYKKVTELLKKETMKSPRGQISFHPDSGFITPSINIEKILLQNNSAKKVVIEQGHGLHFDDRILNEINSESVSGWQNPYLCV